MEPESSLRIHKSPSVTFSYYEPDESDPYLAIPLPEDSS